MFSYKNNEQKKFISGTKSSFPNTGTCTKNITHKTDFNILQITIKLAEIKIRHDFMDSRD